jgi:hypothetical protein
MAWMLMQSNSLDWRFGIKKKGVKTMVKEVSICAVLRCGAGMALPPSDTLPGCRPSRQTKC